MLCINVSLHKIRVVRRVVALARIRQGKARHVDAVAALLHSAAFAAACQRGIGDADARVLITHEVWWLPKAAAGCCDLEQVFNHLQEWTSMVGEG